MQAARHTILLVQSTARTGSRTYYDYETVSAALDGNRMKLTFGGFISHACFHLIGLCNMFEEKLRTQNPHQKQLSYDIADLYTFIDNLADMSALV